MRQFISKNRKFNNISFILEMKKKNKVGTAENVDSAENVDAGENVGTAENVELECLNSEGPEVAAETITSQQEELVSEENAINEVISDEIGTISKEEDLETESKELDCINMPDPNGKIEKCVEVDEKETENDACIEEQGEERQLDENKSYSAVDKSILEEEDADELDFEPDVEDMALVSDVISNSQKPEDNKNAKPPNRRESLKLPKLQNFIKLHCNSQEIFCNL